MLAGASALLPSCRQKAPEQTPSEIPTGFRGLARDLRLQPSLDMFLGAKEFVAGAVSRIPFVLVNANGGSIEQEDVSLHPALANQVNSSSHADYVRFQSGSLHAHEKGSDHPSPFEAPGFYEAEV